MSFKKKAILSSVAAAVIATGATAASLQVDHTGQYLVMPAYYALSDGNWQTKIRVINTNTTEAAVAKVVIREYATSAEDLDFPIYLTPGDVWEGTIYNDNGVVKLKSTDDSMYVNGAFVSSTNPVDVALFDNGPSGNQYGYVEVFGLGQVPANTVPGNNWTLNNPMSKSALRDDYIGTRTGGWHGDVTDLTGLEVVSASGAGSERAMTLVATTIGDFENTGAMPANIIGTDSTPDNLIGAGAKDEIEDALLKDHVFVSYSNNNANETQLLLTQPTKKYDVPNAIAPYWTNVGTAADPIYRTYYSTIARNMLEQTNIQSTDFSGGTEETLHCDTEICYLMNDHFIGSFTTGYVDYKLLGDNPDTDGALPVIPTQIIGENVGARSVVNMFEPAYHAAEKHKD